MKCDPLSLQAQHAEKIVCTDKNQTDLQFSPPIRDTSKTLLVKQLNNGVTMLELSLAEIGGIHPDFARVERELNLAPIETPDRALMPESVMGLVTSIYPLVVSNQSGLFCIGKTALYRWLAAYADPQLGLVRQLRSFMVNRKSGNRCLLCGSEPCTLLPILPISASFDRIQPSPIPIGLQHPGCGGELTVCSDGLRLNIQTFPKAYDTEGRLLTADMG
jgi:hypothetical protein